MVNEESGVAVRKMGEKSKRLEERDQPFGASHVRWRHPVPSVIVDGLISERSLKDLKKQTFHPALNTPSYFQMQATNKIQDLLNTGRCYSLRNTQSRSNLIFQQHTYGGIDQRHPRKTEMQCKKTKTLKDVVTKTKDAPPKTKTIKDVFQRRKTPKTNASRPPNPRRQSHFFESIPHSSLLQIICCESPCCTATSTSMYSNNNWVENQVPEAQMWMQQGAGRIAEFVAAAGPSTVSESRTSTSAQPPWKRLKLGPLKGCGVQRDGIAISAANYVKKYWDEFKEEYPDRTDEVTKVARTPFLPSNADEDINSPVQTRKSARTVAIAASITSATVVLALAFILFKVRRHRLHIREQIPEQFLDFQEHAGQKPPPEVNHANLVGAAALEGGHDSENATLESTEPARLAAKESAAAPSTPKQATRTGETMTPRIRRVEGRLDALFGTRVPESSPPSYRG
ncbi:hypothetical protein C8R45DRAFT_1081994 [Mycena sanguinolenta]|nr:hypothetical protein C8R45DRAFT_1081994 [Mycena sanguinolenta]